MKTLDWKTRLFLYITNAVVEKEKKYTTQEINKNIVYIFNNYAEFKNYFKEYMIDVKEDIIDLAIYTRSKNGGIVALKGLCDYIITKSKIKNSNLDLTQKQIDEIHSRGKITPLEKVEEWQSLDLCAPGDAIGSAKDRCHYFKFNCHECLIDYASQKTEYDKMELKAIYPYNNKKDKVLTKTKKWGITYDSL